MEDLTGKVAVVTGGASGIGEGMAVAFAKAGMHVVVADIEAEKAEQVARGLPGTDVRGLGVGVDVADLASVTRLADRCYDEFGAVHVLCNNAGVLLMGPQADMIADDWSWTFSVNVMGVAHGLQVFLPRMRAQDEPCHVVNTSSVAGLKGEAGLFVYAATKAAVLSISESLREELADSPIDVSVVLPSNIRSNIVGSQRNRPDDSGRHYTQSVAPEVAARHGVDPAGVGERVREGVERGEFYIFTLPASSVTSQQEKIGARVEELLAAVPAGVVPGEV